MAEKDTLFRVFRQIQFDLAQKISTDFLFASLSERELKQYFLFFDEYIMHLLDCLESFLKVHDVWSEEVRDCWCAIGCRQKQLLAMWSSFGVQKALCVRP